jgi:hypothetical protein
MLSGDIQLVITALLIFGLVLVILKSRVVENFTTAAAPNSNPIACGVDLAPCPHPLKCINGYCKRSEPIQREDPNPVQLLPEPNPYDSNSFYPLE